MGCGASKSTAVDTEITSDQSVIKSEMQSKDIKPPIAFEVPGEDDDNARQNGKISIIKSHPPKRLRRLEDEVIELSQQEIERRQLEAEQRRNAILQMRVQSARMSTNKGSSKHRRTQLLNEEEIMNLE